MTRISDILGMTWTWYICSELHPSLHRPYVPFGVVEDAWILNQFQGVVEAFGEGNQDLKTLPLMMNEDMSINEWRSFKCPQGSASLGYEGLESVAIMGLKTGHCSRIATYTGMSSEVRALASSIL